MNGKKGETRVGGKREAGTGREGWKGCPGHRKLLLKVWGGYRVGSAHMTPVAILVMREINVFLHRPHPYL